MDGHMLGASYQLRTPVAPRIDCEIRPSLPPSSWIAVLDGATCSVVCGERVESRREGVFEGVWDAPFAGFDVDLSGNVFGSGLRLRDGTVVFVTPSHTLEAIYVIEHPTKLVVSNSLTFLLQHEGLAVPPHIPIARRLATTVLGVERYRQVLFDVAQGRVGRIVNATMTVGPDGVKIAPRTCVIRFESFASYRDHLSGTIARLVDNGRCHHRDAPYELLTTVSSGYDSATCATLARSNGGVEAVTLTSSRTGRSDSGRQVAEALGLHVHEFETVRPETSQTATNVAEFMASGFGGEDYAFAAFEPMLPGRVLLTGFHGDKIWERSVEANTVLSRGDLSGSSLAEYRLRLGFAHVPVPFIAGRCHPCVASISRSEEMRPFRVGGTYDRPIARRIVEEAGVPRNAFGHQKEMVSVLGFIRPKALPTPAYESLRAYVRDHADWRVPWAQRAWFTRFYAWRIVRKLLDRGGLQRLWPVFERALMSEDGRVFEHSAPLSAEWAFRWGHERIRGRYDTSASTERPPP